MTSKKDGIARLQGVPMFAGMSQKDLARIWELVKIVQHDAGHRVVAEGHSGVGFHLILSGEAVVERKGKKFPLGPGTFFGEMSLIDGGPRTATVTTVTPVVAATLSAWEFKTIVKKNPEMAWNLLVHLTGRLRSEQSIATNLTA